MFIFAGILVISFIAVSGTNGQESCTTASGGRGTCMSINHCSPVFALLRESSNLPPAQADELRRSDCGVIDNTPKVCCPTIGGQVVTTGRSTRHRRSGAVPGRVDVSQHPNLRLINGNKCGHLTADKIISGNKTSVVEFPWMVLIGYKTKGQTEVEFECGGTLINKRWVLTAAHCVTGLSPGTDLSLVRVGEHDLRTERDCDYEQGRPTICATKYQDFPVERSVSHSAYKNTLQGDDIALIRLNGDADFQRTNNVRPICLPVGTTADLNFSKAIATGWGLTDRERARSPDLLKVWLDIVPNAKCTALYLESHSLEITHKQLCAGGKNNRDPCAGDSGGPLQYPNSKTPDKVPRFVQYGVVSFGPMQCGLEGYPSVYSNVLHYVPWILDNIDE